MTKKYSYILFTLLISVLFLFLSFSSEALKGKRSSDGRYLDNGDGTITDTKTNLMWTKKDSYADTGSCMDWNNSQSYVSSLSTGGHTDWRLPTVKELKTIFEKSKSNNMAFDHDSRFPLYLDSIFADGAAYGYWSSESLTTGSSHARVLRFNIGDVYDVRRDFCSYEGVRAVRR